MTFGKLGVRTSKHENELFTVEKLSGAAVKTGITNSARACSTREKRAEQIQMLQRRAGKDASCTTKATMHPSEATHHYETVSTEIHLCYQLGLPLRQERVTEFSPNPLNIYRGTKDMCDDF